MHTTLSPEAQRAVEDSEGNRRIRAGAHQQYTGRITYVHGEATPATIPTPPCLGTEIEVAFTPPGVLLASNGSRFHRTAWLRAVVKDADGEHYITSGQFQILHCSCGGTQREYTQAGEPGCCTHLRAYKFYL